MGLLLDTTVGGFQLDFTISGSFELALGGQVPSTVVILHAHSLDCLGWSL